MSIATPLHIHCICADWCDTCTGFRPAFEQFAETDREAKYSWQILEDLEEAFPDIEVETFPTLLVTDGDGEVQFIGPIMPTVKAMQQIIDAAAAGQCLVAPDLAAEWVTIGRALAVRD